MQKDLGVLVSGYREGPDVFYSFSAHLDTYLDTICFREDYDYYPRGDDEGREFHYSLSIPLSHLDAFLSLLSKRCGSKQPIPQTNKEALLSNLLKQLVAQGTFKDFKTAGISGNLTMIHEWLEKEGIPYNGHFLRFKQRPT
jgi:hypothetical protein